MYAIVDIETTGGYAENHKVTEIAIYHHDGISITGHYRTLINPGRSIPRFITGLTGINYEMVKEAPSFEEIGQEVLGWLKDRVFVAHNAQFDYSFLRKEFETIGIAWSSRKLCTVRLGRKIIPGLTSYGLGRLAESLGVTIEDRHRAGGDAHATAQIFDLLLKRDQDGVILKALRRNSGETILPPNLDKEEFEKLPPLTGVYYFHDQHGKVIYVGKAINIRKRIAGHFTGEAREWNRSNIRNEIHHISFELTGSELIAFILESQEIRRLWPRYNLAQKYKLEEWGIYDYEDRNGCLRFNVGRVVRGTKPLVSFSTKGDAWNFMWEKVRLFELCPKLSGLQLAKGPCFAHQSGTCKGACQDVEPVHDYNRRAQLAVESFHAEGTTVAIVDRGRNMEERSLVLVEKGNYLGFGFIGPDAAITDVESARAFVKPAKESRFAQNLVNSFLRHPRGGEMISFDSHRAPAL
jgi:DNA polymerase-3 subunit epsilon